MFWKGIEPKYLTFNKLIVDSGASNYYPEPRSYFLQIHVLLLRRSPFCQCCLLRICMPFFSPHFQACFYQSYEKGSTNKRFEPGPLWTIGQCSTAVPRKRTYSAEFWWHGLRWFPSSLWLLCLWTRGTCSGRRQWWRRSGPSCPCPRTSRSRSSAPPGSPAMNNGDEDL